MKDFKKEFEELLNESGEYTIGKNFSRYPSEILNTMDETAYNEQLEDFISSKKEEFIETIFENFPAPLAYFFYQTTHAYENEQQRLGLLKDTWEALIYILYSWVLGEIRDKQFSLSNVRVFNKKIRFEDIVSYQLGFKLRFIYNVLEFDKDNGNKLDITKILDLMIVEKLIELNDARNSFSHTTALSTVEAKERYEQLYPKLLDILLEMDFLENLTFKKFLNVEGAMTNIKYSIFTGHSLQKRNYVRKYKLDDLHKISCCLDVSNTLLKFEDNLLDVTPFVYYSTEGNHTRICFLKNFIKDDEKYRFEVVGGNQKEISLEKSRIQTWMDKIVQLL